MPSDQRRSRNSQTSRKRRERQPLTGSMTRYGFCGTVPGVGSWLFSVGRVVEDTFSVFSGQFAVELFERLRTAVLLWSPCLRSGRNHGSESRVTLVSYQLSVG